jgi:hypothetical protein
VAKVIVVLRVMITSVSTRSPETVRPVAPRHEIAATTHARATTIAVETFASTTTPANRTAGATTAVATLVTTRLRMALSRGSAGSAGGSHSCGTRSAC